MIPPEGSDSDADWRPDWNFLMSLPLVVQSPAKNGEGDEQTVVSTGKEMGAFRGSTGNVTEGAGGWGEVLKSTGGLQRNP